MALFPKCTFEVRVPNNGVVRAGERLRGELTLDVPEPIPRAEHLDLFFRTTATAGYGGGKNRTVVVKNLLTLPMHVDFPKDVPLPAGKHTWPFELDIPAWVPPNYRGNDCSIANSIDVRLDVDWAVDPKTSVTPEVHQLPIATHASPVTTRSPDTFHEHIVVELTLESSIVAVDQPIRGFLALRGGHNARYDAIVISVLSVATISMSQGDRREGGGLSVRIPKEALAKGESVPFHFMPSALLKPSFRNGYIDHAIVMRVKADIPWSADPFFDIALQLLPEGSNVVTDTNQAATVGAMRLRQIASIMAAETGLPVGRLPALVEGKIGPIAVRLADSPLSGRLGLDLDFSYPDLELGIAFRPVGLLDAFRESPLLPSTIGATYILRVEALANDAVRPFIDACLVDVARATDIRFSDHHLSFHFNLTDDGSQSMTQFARFAADRAKAIAYAIGNLPFPQSVASAADAWRATATEQNAFLAPHVPALHDITFNARVLGGEARSMSATIRTVWRAQKPVVVVDVDLREAALAKSIAAEIENGTGLAGVRAMLPVIHATTQEKVHFEAAGWVPDPRALLGPLEQFFDAVLESRGERRTDSPYR